MKKYNRDLLILRKEDASDPSLIKREIMSLNTLLQSVEMSDSVSCAYEFIDINTYRISHKKETISKALNAGYLKPFQFLLNLN